MTTTSETVEEEMEPTGSNTDDWRDELVATLERILPAEWIAAAKRGDIDEIQRIRSSVDRPAIVSALGREGWVTPHWKPEYGGRGMSMADARKIAEFLDEWEVPRLPFGAGLALAAPAILEWGSEEVKRRFLPPIAAGDERWCQLFSEPGAGSDLASLATTAVRDGDTWIVNGQKVWTTFAHKSQFGMLLARTDPDSPKHAGITYFGVDMSSPGVEVRPLINIAGQAEFNEVFLTDVRVPDAHRISRVGKGWQAGLTTLASERSALAQTRRTRSRASDAVLGGKNIDDVVQLARSLGLTSDPVWRQRIAEEWTKQRLLQLNTRRARANAAIDRAGPEGSIAKIFKASANQSLQVLAIDLLGAAATAWTQDETQSSEFVTQFLRTRGNSIEGGTSEIQRNIIGERVLGLPREPDPYRGVAWREVPRS